MARPLAVIGLILSLIVGPICTTRNEEPIGTPVSNKTIMLPGPLSQSAPYITMFDKNTGQGGANVTENRTAPRDVLFRLTNDTQLRRQHELAAHDQDQNQNKDDQSDDKKAWMLISPNGTIVGHRLSLNIEKLLDSLSSNNFTSEVRVDHADPERIVNITISAASSSAAHHHQQQQHRDSDSPAEPLDEMLLEELILDAMPVFRDNHRFGLGKNRTLRPKPPPSDLVTMITPPPIRTTMEVVAENYTTRKVSEEANVFSLKLLHQINIEKLGNRNLIQAPFAVYQGLGLLMTGSMGDTARELDKVLLGVQSTYENQKLTHDQDRNRLLASFSDVVRQLYSSATHHVRGPATLSDDDHQQQPSSSSSSSSISDDFNDYGGGTSEQHLIMANSLLFSSSAYEISHEFKQYIANYYNRTATLMKVEVGSTESIHTINGWIRRITRGLVATIINKQNTFDETNVMSMLSTSWLKQEWRDTFHIVESPIRSGIRLKGQGSRAAFGPRIADRSAKLLEFVADNKQSYFVDYIKSEPTKNIHVYRSILGNSQPVELITVPFKDSNHRLITITPISPSSNASFASLLQQPPTTDSNVSPMDTLPDSSSLSKLVAYMSNNPRKVMRSIWNIIAPDIITKQTLQSIQQARQKNITIDEQLVGANVIPLVQLSMPVIRTGSDSSLSAALNHIGVVNTFDPYQANFIGINGHPFNYYKLHLSNVLFKTTLNLNERGINYDRTIRTLESMRIHSSTSNQRQRQSDEKNSTGEGTSFSNLEFVDDVKLNKPFVYMICDMRTKLILYMGTIRNPAQTE